MQIFFDFQKFPGFTPWDMAAGRTISSKELIENSRSTKRDWVPMVPPPYAVHWCIELTENNKANGPQKRGSRKYMYLPVHAEPAGKVFL